MSKDFLDRLQNEIIIDIDNKNNKHLSEPSYVRYLISSFKNSNVSCLYTGDLRNMEIIRNSSDFNVIFNVDFKENNSKNYYLLKEYISFKPEAIIIDFTNKAISGDLELILTFIKQNYDGILIGNISSKFESIKAYRLGIDAFLIRASKKYVDYGFISEICSDINISTIVSIDNFTKKDIRDMISYGVHSFVVGEEITNPNKIIEEYVSL